MGTPSEAPLPRRKPRILLVDDDTFLLRSVVRIMSLFGPQVVPAPGGAEALETLARDLDFDLVIFDMDMPPLHGPEFMRLALAQHAELRGRLVVATGCVDEFVQAVAAEGDCRVVEKPYSADKIKALLSDR
ncbi:MAG: response regulator [Polyangiales bacterium]